MADFAPRLANLKPKINWENSCNDQFCAKTNLNFQRGKITVPSDYESPSATFEVGVQRITAAGKKPRIHLILLAGGPGGYGEDVIVTAETYILATNGDVASYLVDHRGLGSSGEIVPRDVSFYECFDSINQCLAKPPFDIRHLTPDNAALDVGMIAMAIKSSPEWMPDSRIVAYGFSYGSQWAHQSAMRLPNLYDSVVMGGTYFPEGASKDSLQGVAENCAMDTFCRKKMGGNTEQTYRKTVRNILNPNYNECTALFHKAYDKIHTEPAGEDIRVLAFMLRDLVMGDSSDFNDSQEYRSVMALLPILKATSDCLDVNEYRKKILIPFDKYIRSFYKSDFDGSGGGSNSFVHTITVLNSDYCYTGSKIPYISPDHSDLHPEIAAKLKYYHNYQDMEPYLRGRKCTIRAPARSTKTVFFVAQSRMDITTPHLGGWELYQKIEAPSKSWLLYEHRSHDGYYGKCMAAFMTEALYGAVEFDYEACMREENAERKVDWTLKHAPDFKNVWDLVADESDTTPVFKPVPTYTTESRPGFKPTEPTEPLQPEKPSTRMLFLGICGILTLVVVAAVVLYFLYKRYRSKPQDQEQGAPV